ncbi:MAG: methyltransferase domain-containing protein, partial [Acidobacteriota bacterium]|nr:methyltransferase domain-containing protein [Acidobacteriota bacterium]
MGVALRFLAAGAARVVCVDKFYSRRDVAHEREIYSALRERLSADEKHRFDEAINIANGINFDAARLSCINGLDLEAAAEQLSRQEESFNLIISRAVVEEIYEPDNFLLAADKVLAPGGLMLHKIDLSDYGIFSEGGMHPLTFLTIPKWIYRLMATDSGIPNRKLIGYYRKQMAVLDYETKFLVTSVLGHGFVVPHQEH